MTSSSAAARDVAKATGTEFGDDALGAIMRKYDKNGDGVFQIDEVRSIVFDVSQAQTKNKMLRKFIGLLMLIVVLTLLAMFGVSFAAGFALKDSKVDMPGKQGVTTSPLMGTDGTPISVELTESEVSFFNLPSIPTAELAALSSVTAYVDMKTAPVGAVVEYTAQLVSAYKADDTKAYLETAAGHTIEIDASAKTATINIRGTSYPVSDQPPSSRMLEGAEEVAHPRRQARRGGFLRAGNFRMKKSSNRGGNT